MRAVVVRGCPGQGTTWFARILQLCTYSLLGFSNVQVSSDRKHEGCHKNSTIDPTISEKIWVSSCYKPNCVHAVIARHPMELKHGRAETYKVWEAYYGAWMHSVKSMTLRSAILFRYEDLVNSNNSCIRRTVPQKLKLEYFQRMHKTPSYPNKEVWGFWNYTV